MSFKSSKWLALLILTGGGYWYWSHRDQTITTEQKTGKVEKGDLLQRVTISGMVVPTHSVAVTAPYDGYVRKLFVKVGDQVRVGDPLVSVSQLPNGKNEEVYPITSPIRGVVVTTLKSEGEFVEHSVGANTQNAILRVDDLSKLYIESDVAEMDYPKLKVGQSVLIKAAAITTRTYKGRIESIAQASKTSQDRWDRSRVEFSLRVVVLDADDQLRPGMSTMVDVITKELKNVLVLRHEYIWQGKDKDQGKYYAITTNGEHRDLTLGEQNEEVSEVKSGLTEGVALKQVDYTAM